jgi:hypothetical protein
MVMNISEIRTRVKGGATAFGATALNERSHLVMKSAERVESPTAKLLDVVC